MLRGIRLASAILVVTSITLLQGCAAVLIGGAAVGGAIAHDRRTAGTVIDDQGLELKAMDVMNKHPELSEQSDINVTSYNHTLLLTGDADNDEIRRRYASLVGKIPQVRRVLNEVVIGAEATISETTHDAYLTTKTKLALSDLHIEGFDVTRVKVVTHRGTVYLMGLVTREEGKAAAEQVRYVDGVLRVVKVFEYIDR